MQFDRTLISTYRMLLQTTDLQAAYLEWFGFFSSLRTLLERQMPGFRFQKSVSENAMQESYFTFSSEKLRRNGLKLAVVFCHASFTLEVRIAGVNRAVQVRRSDLLRCQPPFLSSADPAHTDYILRLPVMTDLSCSDTAAADIRQAVRLCLSEINAAE